MKNIVIFLFLKTGEKLLPSEKYTMSEYALNEYSWQMNLTVNSLEKKDFGEYVCSSVNALGKADGIVRLQGKYLRIPVMFHCVFLHLFINSTNVFSYTFLFNI